MIDQTDVNANRKLNEKEGFAKPVEGGCFVGNIRFEPGEPGTKTRMNRTDATNTLRSIAEARRQADVVLVSHHSHERKGMDKELPADFLPGLRTSLSGTWSGCLHRSWAAYLAWH